MSAPFKFGIQPLVNNRKRKFRRLGTHSEDSVDYPVYGHAVAKAVADGSCEKGIVICTTGIGISIAANKVPGIRCALCSDSLSAKMTRLHNDANVLALGGGFAGNRGRGRTGRCSRLRFSIP